MSRISITLIFSLFFLKFSESKMDLPTLGIIGGSTVNIEDYYYQAAFLVNGLHTCGGVIYKTDTILTAAHCVRDIEPSTISIRVGSASSKRGGQRLNVKSIDVHPKYDSTTKDYDLAILHLNGDFKFGPTINSIEIADKEPADGSVVTTSGWGRTDVNDEKYSILLNAVDLEIIPRKECFEKNLNKIAITENMICAGTKTGGKDSCTGDSGGPLVQDKKLVGIVSVGIGCADVKHPGAYANVVKLHSWINEKTN